MIDFRGELCGNAKLFFINKVIKKLHFIYIVVFACLTPLVVLFAYNIGVLRLIWVYPLAIAILCLFTWILYKKFNKDILIRRVYIEGKYIFSITEKENNKFKLNSVKKVTDYGEFYFVEFSPLIPVPNIVCQKNLLSKGTVEDFEKLFEDKITKKPIR